MKRNCAFLFISFYLLSGTVFAIKPKADYINTPKDFGIPYVETTIKSDAATLLTWYLAQPEKATAPTMIMCNADYGNMSYQLRTAAALYGLGYNVVLFDYRGFGHSSPFAIDTNQLYYNEFVSDFFTVCSYYYAQSKRPLLVYGQSMGTIVATLGLAKSAELKDSKFIYESFIEDLTHTTAVLKQMKNRTFTLPPNYTEYNNAVHSLKNRAGLVFVGADDVIAAAGAIDYAKTRWTVVPYKGGHLAGSYILGEAFYSQISAFLK